jgi:hypothetical protein
VISLGAIVVSRSVRVGGYDLDEAIGAHIRNAHRMAIGSQSAEAIKLEIGSAAPLTPEIEAEVRPRPAVRAAAGASSSAAPGSPSDRRSAVGDPRGAAGDAGGDAAGAGGRYRQARHPAGRRRLAAARVRRARPCSDRDAGAPGRVTAYLRGGGRGALPRGARRSRAVKDVGHAGALVIARSLNPPLWTPDRVGAGPRPRGRDRSSGTLHARQGQPPPAPR